MYLLDGKTNRTRELGNNNGSDSYRSFTITLTSKKVRNKSFEGLKSLYLIPFFFVYVTFHSIASLLSYSIIMNTIVHIKSLLPTFEVIVNVNRLYIIIIKSGYTILFFLQLLDGELHISKLFHILSTNIYCTHNGSCHHHNYYNGHQWLRWLEIQLHTVD